MKHRPSGSASVAELPVEPIGLGLEPCPYLPSPDESVSWRDMNELRTDQGAAFYMTALRWGQNLWLRELPARALLALDRALYADLQGDEPELAEWPLPYAAVGWIVKNAPQNVFLGNPRVHYQHLADRVGGAHCRIRRWRAWACWSVVHRVRPDLPRDCKHGVAEPSRREITAKLEELGYPGEADLYNETLLTL